MQRAKVTGIEKTKVHIFLSTAELIILAIFHNHKYIKYAYRNKTSGLTILENSLEKCEYICM